MTPTTGGSGGSRSPLGEVAGSRVPLTCLPGYAHHASMRTSVLSLASVLLLVLLACKKSEPTRADPGTTTPPTPVLDGAPTPKPTTDPLWIPCLESTWLELSAAASETWTKRDCGDGLTVSYKRHKSGVSVIIKAPRRGKKASAVMKSAIESVMPNLPAPKSFGACEPSPALISLFRQTGGDVSALKERTRNQGGNRVARFLVGATTLHAEGFGTWNEGKMDDEGTGAIAEFRLVPGGDFDESAWTTVPWEAQAPCDYPGVK